jgi:hypothetical protein
MNAIWLFLYLGCLVHLLTLYRLDLNRPATLLMALPILILPLMDRLCRYQPWLLGKGVLRGAGLTSLLSALILARTLNLGFWETRHLGLAALCGLLGLGLLLVIRSFPREGAEPGLWLWIAAWQVAGFWHPVLTFVGAGLSAFLGAWGWWPEGDPPPITSRRLGSFWSLALLGLVLPKPWFDFNLEATWAPVMAVFALAVGVAGLPRLRQSLDRLPNAVPLVLLGLAFVLYPSAWALAWGAVLGLGWGVLWPRLPRPLALTRVSLGFVLGLLVSYALHSNLGIPFLRRLLWWGS